MSSSNCCFKLFNWPSFYQSGCSPRSGCLLRNSRIMFALAVIMLPCVPFASSDERAYSIVLHNLSGQLLVRAMLRVKLRVTLREMLRMLLRMLLRVTRRATPCMMLRILLRILLRMMACLAQPFMPLSLVNLSRPYLCAFCLRTKAGGFSCRRVFCIVLLRSQVVIFKLKLREHASRASRSRGRNFGL